MAGSFFAKYPDLQSSWKRAELLVRSLVAFRGQVRMALDPGVASPFLLNACALLHGAIDLAAFPPYVLEEPGAKTTRHLCRLLAELRTRFRIGGFDPVIAAACCCLAEPLSLSASAVQADFGKVPAPLIIGLGITPYRLRLGPKKETDTAIADFARKTFLGMLELAPTRPWAMEALQNLADIFERPLTKDDFGKIASQWPDADAQLVQIQQSFQIDHLVTLNKALEAFEAYPLGQVLPGRLLDLIAGFEERQIIAELESEFLLAASNHEREKGGQLFVDDIDSFIKVRDVNRDLIAHAVVGGFLDKSEDDVQLALEQILEVPDHKKDWAGERNDLYTGNVMLNGTRRTTAFLLKGPGIGRKEMEIRDCGKAGDQLVRLFHIDAVLYVVQYIGPISELLIDDVRGKVIQRRNAGRECYFLIMDGQDTARVLHAYGKL